MARQPDPADRRDEPRRVVLRSRRSRLRADSLLPRLWIDLRRMDHHAGISENEPDVSGVGAISMAEGGRTRHAQAPGCAEWPPAVLVRGRRSRAGGAGAENARPDVGAFRKWSTGRQSGPAAGQ